MSDEEPEAKQYPKIQGGRVDPGDAFVLDGEVWYVIASGGLAAVAQSGDGRARSYSPEQLREARRVGSRWLGLMQAIGAAKGIFLGSGFAAASGMPQPIRDWMVQELRELETLVAGIVDDLEEQAAEAEA